MTPYQPAEMAKEPPDRPSAEPRSALEGLSDDLLAHTLLYSDFTSAVTFASAVNKNLRAKILPNDANNRFRENLQSDTPTTVPASPSLAESDASVPSSRSAKVQKSAFDKLWADVFNRHGFAATASGIARENSNDESTPVAKTKSATALVSETHRRRALFDNLTGESRLRKDRALQSAASASKGASGASGVDTANSTRKAIKKCLSLPNRYVHFVPLIPQLDLTNEEDREMQEIMEEDPPPVDFGCESFSLLPGTSPRFILMNPFDGSIAIHDDVLAGAVRSDEAMIEDAFRAGADAIIRRRNSADNDTASDTNNNEHDQDAMDTQEEAETSADAIEREVEMNHNVSRRPAPSQVLHDIQDYFNTDLNEYFIPASTDNASDPNDQAAIVMGENDEVVVDWLGLDLHPIVTAADGLVGNMVGAARVLTCESSADMAVQDATATRSCMEVLGWKSMGGDDAKYDEAYVCRMPGFPNYVDIDARRNAVYATFGPGEGPPLAGRELPSRPFVGAVINDGNGYGNDEEDDLENLDLDWNGQPVRPSNTIVRYPFILKDSGSSIATMAQARRRYFPQPEAYIETRRPVSCFVIDPTGDTLAVGTEGGYVEIWSTSNDTAKRLQTLHLLRDIDAAKERERLATLKLKRLRSVSDVAPPEGGGEYLRSTEKDEKMPDIGEVDMLEEVMGDNGSQDAMHGNAEEEIANNDDIASGSSLTQCKSDRKIDSIFHPRHMEVHRAGFVTMQHHRSEGATLALWQKLSMRQSGANEDEPFELSALINLPLSLHRKPQVHYDGRRLIVFGQDHIGLIVLVYHVLSTWEDKDAFVREDISDNSIDSVASKSEESGGVINLSPRSRRVRYANRIRHAGLGGIPSYDLIFMTCNERFLVLNTKVGNIVGGDGGTNASEGLIVIDLEEKA